ncbi:MAG TPA: BON domain-containing protein [Opitutaceae bacterium]|nr:BON domain-containing protein [Opitutaceae bacterium]
MKIPITVIALVLVSLTPASLMANYETDRKIEDAAKASYNYHAILQDRVKVKAQDGVVTLTGTVPDKNQKTLAEDTVSDLPGVVDVNNQIKVESSAPEHSDDWIAFKIRSMLLMKAHVSASNTHVTVKDGVVSLTGTADSTAQKELTEAYVKDVEGVKSVRNDLTVNSPAPTAQPRAGDTVDDASITAQIKYQLLIHRSTSALKTKVETRNGMVTINGEADSPAEKDLVTRLATDVRGVKSVDNSMTIKQ